MSSHNGSPMPDNFPISLHTEESIREVIEAEIAKAHAMVDSADSLAPAIRDQMRAAADQYWAQELERRLAARAELQAEHDARLATEQAEREARAQRLRDAQELLQVQTQAALNVKELVTSELASKKGESKRIEMESGVGPSSDMDAWWPAKSILKKIEQGDYDFDLWHLTKEGAEASQAAASKGGNQIMRSEDGLLKVEEHAERKGRPQAEVAGLVKLNVSLTRWPEFSKYPRAIRIWHRRHRFHWVQDEKDPDKKRFDLGAINPDWWPKLKTDEEIRQNREEIQALRELAVASLSSSVASTSYRREDISLRKRISGEEHSGNAAKRQSFRTTKCLVCGSRDSQHDFAHCQAKTRADGKNQLVHRLPNGTLEFKDDHKIPCINFNVGQCKNRACPRAHRCASCGTRAHGDVFCSQQ
ncbi:unnamed protein product [Tilletia controversa]|nr:unnamed protein product [Tilletia controversa]